MQSHFQAEDISTTETLPLGLAAIIEVDTRKWFPIEDGFLYGLLWGIRKLLESWRTCRR